MSKIGIVENVNKFEIIEIIKKLYAAYGLAANIYHLNGEQAELEYYDIIVINHFPEERKNLPTSGILIINSDTKPVSELAVKEGTSVITYGLNKKACVTASSMDGNDFLYCIQRAFSTISGKSVIQQEFEISVSPPDSGTYDIHSMLAAVTAALADSVKIKSL